MVEGIEESITINKLNIHTLKYCFYKRWKRRLDLFLSTLLVTPMKHQLCVNWIKLSKSPSYASTLGHTARKTWW